jgi:8-oxo-dGTP pyrophosphatase MutT (NUDIX family)
VGVGQDRNPLSAGVVLLRRIDNEWHYLLLRAYQYWDFPKGLVEPGEQAFDAAVREVEEETTLVDLDFCWGNDFFQTPPYGKIRKIARYYLARCDNGEVELPIAEELGRPEHEEFRWVTASQARQLVSPRVKRVLEWAEGVIVPNAEKG